MSTQTPSVQIEINSWSAHANAFLAVLAHGTPAGKALCKREILRMAQIADLGVTALNTLVAINDSEPERLTGLEADMRKQIGVLIAQGVALSNAPQAPQSYIEAQADDVAIAPAASVAIGLLAKKHCGVELPLDVCRSNAGFYIGTFGDDGPCSRESVQYWPTREAAQQALATGTWTQRTEP
jgi:hypothetical protein